MKYKFTFALLVVAGIILLSGCKSEEEIKGLAYDPPGATITTDKPIFLQPKRTFYFSKSKLYVSNEFEGARLNDLYLVNDSTYTAIIEPENAPTNNSAWYAFKIWSVKPQDIYINLTYKDGTHRYIPKISYDGSVWTSIDTTLIETDTSKTVAKVKLIISEDTLWFSSQELITSSIYDKWERSISTYPFVSKKTIGLSSEGKPINALRISESNNNQDYIVIIGRQHPPEVTGFFALKAFVETITDRSETAVEFRKKFNALVIPLVNPDGIDNGHWRHNFNGVDLNRDWVNFNQPEPRTVKDEIKKLVNGGGKIKFFIDFHSTQKDVFYSMTLKSLITDNYSDDEKRTAEENHSLMTEWLANLQNRLPDYPVNIIDTLSKSSSPTSDRWMQREFNSPAITYEVGDETDRELIKKVAGVAVIELMKLLLEGTN